MNRTFRLLCVFLAIATGCLFLYSAYTKLFPIQAFEYTMVEDAHLPRMVAAIAARCLIALEATLGALMVLHLFGRGKWVLKAAFWLLALFSAYLVFLWVTVGNNVNCGCFGDQVWMSPSASLIKNVILLVVTWLLIKHYKGFTYRWAYIVSPLLLAATIALVFILVPVFRPYKIDLSPIYKTDSTANIPPVDLAKGRHIIAFLSPSCIHCRHAGLKMHTDILADPALPFFMIIGGTSSPLTDFWKAAQAQEIPHVRMDKDLFMKYTKGVFPYIIWVNNGLVEEETSYKDLSPAAIEKWLHQ